MSTSGRIIGVTGSDREPTYWRLETRSGSDELVFLALLTKAELASLAGWLLVALPDLDEFVLRAGSAGERPLTVVNDPANRAWTARASVWTARRLRPELRRRFGAPGKEPR
jgi:hypothetical protein